MFGIGVKGPLLRVVFVTDIQTTPPPLSKLASPLQVGKGEASDKPQMVERSTTRTERHKLGGDGLKWCPVTLG